MDSLLLLLQSHQMLVSSLASVLVSLLIVYFWWAEIRYWLHNLSCSLPFIGKVASLSRQLDQRDRDNWYPSERELCASYHRFYQQQALNPEFFDKCRDYLNKAQETGRNSLPVIAWILMIVMVLVEALGFSYVLAGYTIPGASEKLQRYGAYGIAFLVSVILVYFTHNAGQEMHKNALVRKIRGWYNADPEARDLQPDNSISLETSFKDHSQKAYQQLLNRVDTNAYVRPTYLVTWLTLIFIGLVAIGATYVRGKVLEQEQTQITTGTLVNPFADPLPAELTEQKQAADQQANHEIQDADKKAGWATFIVLAVIFVFLQFLGILLGMKTGFAGKESANARRYIGRFASREAFALYYDRKRQQVIRDAQDQLRRLQAKISKRVQRQSISARETLNQQFAPCSNSFEDYVELCERRRPATNSQHSTRTDRLPPNNTATAKISEATIEIPISQLHLLAQMSHEEQQAFQSMTSEQQALLLAIKTRGVH